MRYILGTLMTINTNTLRYLTLLDSLRAPRCRLTPLANAIGIATLLLTGTALAQNESAKLASLPMTVTAPRQGFAADTSVSATRTGTPLNEIPQSVQVITRALIEQQQVQTFDEALQNVSGVRATRSEEALFAQPIVRGFPAEIYLDGLPAFGGTAASIDPTSLNGAERIEVLKGPTSALYGGGVGAPLGGMINVVSQRPAFESDSLIGVRSGSYSTQNVFTNLNIPLSDQFAARLAADYQESDSFIDHVESRHWSIQPSLLFKPTPQTELLLRGNYNKRSQTEYSGLPAAQALAGDIKRNAYPGATLGQPLTTIENQVTALAFDHRFSDTTRISISGQHYDGDVHDYGSFINGNPDSMQPTLYSIAALYLPTTIEENTLDAHLISQSQALGGDHELMIGASIDLTTFDSAVSGAVPIGELDLANPVYNLVYGETPELLVTQTNRYRTQAVYLQNQATYGRLHLLGSVRYSQLSLEQAEQNIDRDYHRVIPRLGATFDLTDQVAAYAAYSEGFRGAFNFTGREEPKPETSRNVETGLKLDAEGWGLSGTLAIFEQTRRNVSTADPDPSFALMGYSVQSGEQRARGIEMDLTWEPTPALSLLANYAYTSAEITEDNIIPIGDGLPRVPRHSGRLAAHYRLLDGPAQGLALGAGVTALSARELTLPNTQAVPGYAMLDAQASYDFDRYTVALSAINLTDRESFDTYQYLGSPVVIPIQPRSAYVSFTAHF